MSPAETSAIMDSGVEQALVAGVLQGLQVNDLEAHKAIRAIPLAAFQSVLAVNAWTALQALYEAGTKIDLVSFKLALKKQGVLGSRDCNWAAAYKPWLDKAPHANLAVLASGVLGDYRRRALGQVAFALSERCLNPTLDPSETVQEAMQALAEIQAEGVTLASEPLAKEVRALLAGNGNLADPTSDRIGFTGIETLDDVYPLGQGMTVIGARPNVGKSILGAQVAVVTAERDKKAHVLYVNLDMPHGLMRRRMTACAGKVSMFSLIKGEFTVPERQSLDAGLYTLERVHLVSLPAQTPWSRLEAMILEHVRLYGVKLVVLDYFQQIGRKFRSGTQSDASAFSAVSAAIKALSLRSDGPRSVVLLSQVGREGAQGEPGLSELKETGSLEQDALGVFLIWADPPKAEDDPNSFEPQAKNSGKFTNSDSCHIRLAKSQVGLVGRHVRVTRKGSISRFVEEVRMTS
jgi:replicative DNA helicase